MKERIRQSALSLAVFVIVLAGLVSVDERVRERFTNLVASGEDLSPWGDRLADLGSALVSAARHQSIEHAPLLIFATVGGVLFVFMLRT